MWPALVKAIDAAKKAGRETYAYRRSFTTRNRWAPAGTYAATLRQSYWVTSERGVYLLRAGAITQVAAVPCYGLAFSGEHIYLSAYYGHYTAVLKGNRAALEKAGASFEFKEIHGYKTSGSNERIHQTFPSPRHLWCASTGRNTLLQFDLATDRLLAEWPLFYDAFKKPILYDNHHINSVSIYGDVVLFVAYRAGHGSLLGCLHHGEIIGFPYPHKGVHDIFLTGDNFLFCDTFGPGQVDRGGSVLDRDGVIDLEFFARPPGYIVRGLAGDGEELLVGHSHKGERRKRFSGQGSVLVVRGRKVVAEIKLPCAQVYQIVRHDGSYVLPPAAAPKLGDVTSLLTQSLGPAVYRERTEPLPTNQQESG